MVIPLPIVNNVPILDPALLPIIAPCNKLLLDFDGPTEPTYNKKSIAADPWCQHLLSHIPRRRDCRTCQLANIYRRYAKKNKHNDIKNVQNKSRQKHDMSFESNLITSLIPRDEGIRTLPPQEEVPQDHDINIQLHDEGIRTLSPHEEVHQDHETNIHALWNKSISTDILYMSTPDIHGNKYILHTRCQKTGWRDVRFMKNRSAPSCLEAFKQMQAGKPHTNDLRCDGGKEFHDIFKQYCTDNKIKILTSSPDDHNFNAAIESAHRTLLAGVRALLLQAGLGINFSSYAATYYTLVYNHTCGNAYQKVTGHAYNNDGTLIPWGCEAIVLHDDHIKTNPNGISMITIGVDDGGYILTTLRAIKQTNRTGRNLKIYRSKNVSFRPRIFPARTLHNLTTHDLDIYTIYTRTPQCGKCEKAIINSPSTCRPCILKTRGVHQNTEHCLLNRCKCVREEGENPSAILDMPLNSIEICALIKSQQENTHWLCVAKLLDIKECKDMPEVKEAIQKEINAFLKHTAFDFENPMLKTEIAYKHKDAVFCHFRTILSIKGYENADTADHIYKARTVNQNLFFDVNGRRLQEVVNEFSTPACTAALNVVINHAFTHKDYILLLDDVSNAYLQSDPIQESRPLYAILPSELHLPDWKFPPNTQVCVPVRKPIYGMPSADRKWNKTINRIHEKLGYTKLIDYDWSTYIKHHDNHILLRGLFIDDISSAGLKSHVTNERTLLSQEVELKPPSLQNKLLGQTITEIPQTEPTKRGYIRDTSPYVRFTLDEYKRLIGLKGRLKPHYTPISKGSWDPTDEEPGQHAHIARKMVGSLGWIFNNRPDIGYTLSVLRTAQSRWTKGADKILRRIMGYLEHTVNKGILNIVDSRDFLDSNNLELTCYTDADWGGCEDTLRSTRCYLVYLTGKHGTRALISHGVKKEEVPSTSTACAEISAIDLCLKKAGIPTHGMLQQIYGKNVQLSVECDNEAAIKAIKKGYSAELRFMKKSHGLSISFLHNMLAVHANSYKIKHVPTGLNPADLGTKALGPQDLIRELDLIGLINIPQNSH